MDMNNLIMHFSLRNWHDGAGSIIWLEEEIYLRLLDKGQLSGSDLGENLESDKLREGICLVYCYHEGLEVLWELKPPESLDPLLSKAHLGVVSAGANKELRLVSPENLLVFLPKLWKSEEKAWLDVLPLLGEDIEGFKISRESIDLLNCRKEFSSRTDISSCGDPYCCSDFAWIDNYVCMIYIGTGCDDVCIARIFPFRTL